MIRFYILFFLISFLHSLKAQEPFFIQHDLGDANLNISINTLLQDQNSMIWIGTDNGLARFDGNIFYPINIDTSGAKTEVTALFEDDRGIIWVGTKSGKIFFLDHTRQPKVFEIQEGHPTKPITAIIQDQYHHIWFATYGEGAYVYTGNRLFNYGIDDGLSGNEIYTMTHTSKGEIWIGTDDGINICTFINEKKSVRSFGLSDGLPDQIIRALKADEHGNVWIGTFEHGVVYYNASLQKITRPFDSAGLDEITSLEIFDGLELWIGTRKNGAWRYNPQTGFLRKLVNLEATRPGEISDIITDVEGNIWISLEEGFLLSAHRPFESLVLNIGEVQTLFASGDNRLWIGTKTGLYRLEENATELSKPVRVAPLHDWNVTDIIEDHFHNLWIGTLDKGLFVFHPASGIVKHIGQTIPMVANTIMSMATTKDVIWVSTLEGVLYYPKGKNILNEPKNEFKLISDPWKSSLHFVFQVFVDSKDRAWFATDGNGVYSITGEKVTQYVGTDSIVLQTVYSVCEDHRGHLWFNTLDHGLVEFDGYNYKPLSLAEGLGNTSIASIASAGTGDLVVVHNRGIDLMEPDRRHFMYYNDEIGIKETDAQLNTITTDSRGHVYISGKNLLIKHYASEHDLSIHPKTQLTRVSVFGQPVDFSKINLFDHDENYITFHYVGLWFTSPHSVNYQYKLEGYDLDWKESKDNIASYSSLSPGRYTFSVMASENKFFLDEPISAYSFTIGKPFWIKAWFIVLAILAAGALLYWVIKSREQRYKKQTQIKRELIESQLQAIKAQINPHFLFNSFNTLITIIDENTGSSTLAIEYVEKLSDYFRSILQYREAESISLEEEWELVQNFGYLLQKRYGSNLRLHMDPPQKDAYIFPLTLQMLVENAVKHNVIAKHKPLDVFISIDDGYIVVRNNMQPKVKSEPSTQFGLQSVVKRYQLLTDKKVIIHKDNNTFKVCIPIIYKSAE